MRYLIHISILLSIVTYMFWEELPKGSFYLGNSLLIALVTLHIYLRDKKNMSCFLLFSLSSANFLDELEVILRDGGLIQEVVMYPLYLSFWFFVFFNLIKLHKWGRLSI